MEGRFRRLFEAHPDALLVRARDGTISEANEAAADLFDCDLAELIGRRLEHLTRDLDVPDLDDRLAELSRGDSMSISTIGIRADERPFGLALVLTIDPDGSGDSFITARDVDERRRLEKGLFELAELARIDDSAEVSLASVGSRAMNLARQLVDADRSAICAIHGRDQTVEWLASHGLEGLIAAAADLRPAQIPWLARALETGVPEVIDRRSPSHQRTALSDAADLLGIAAFAIVPLQVAQQSTGVLGLVWSDDPPDSASSLDVLATVGRLVGLALANARLGNALISRQKALDESEARYRALFQGAPDAMVITTWDGQVIDANDAAATLYGLPHGQLLGIAADRLWRLTRAQRAALFAELRRERRASTSAVGVRADGSRFRQLMTVAVAAFRGEESLLVEARDGGPLLT